MKYLVAKSLIIFSAFTQSYLSAEQITFSSPDTKVQLVELYTSQGCHSCPPAEHKLSELVQSPLLWNEIVPIAFHVDYWDYLGWKDIYAEAKNTRKQQEHRALGNISSIYTPGFVVDGKEWRGFFRGKRIPRPQAIPAGKLNLTWQSEGNNVGMSFQNLSSKSPSSCHFAVLTFDKVNIKAGENRGRTLQQDFSSLSSRTQTIEVKNNQYVCTTSLDKLKTLANLKQDRKLALVGWVSTADKKPIQATGGWL